VKVKLIVPFQDLLNDLVHVTFNVICIVKALSFRCLLGDQLKQLSTIKFAYIELTLKT
jgi:hypothetical protein